MFGLTRLYILKFETGGVFVYIFKSNSIHLIFEANSTNQLLSRISKNA